MNYPHISPLWHELESVTAAWEHARALGNYPQADTLLDRRAALVTTITRRLAGATAKVAAA